MGKPSHSGLCAVPPPADVVAPDQSNLVKSATRVLDILDLFARQRRPMRASEIGDALEFPRSSALVLLRTMVETGHLIFDARGKTYFPSVRVAQLGGWLSTNDEGSLLGLLTCVRKATGESTILAVQNGVHVQFIALLPALELGPSALEGMKTRMIGSACGGALMMAMADAEIIALVRRIRHTLPRAKREAEVAEVIAQVHEFRRRGYSYTYRTVMPGTLTLGVPIRTKGMPPLSLSVGGSNARIQSRREEIVATMRGFVASYCARGQAWNGDWAFTSEPNRLGTP